MQSADGGTTDVSLAEGALGFNSVEVCNHLLLGKGFEGIKAEATSFEGRASVGRNQLGVHFGGNRKFYQGKKTVLVNGVHSVHNRRAIYHVVRSRKEQGDPWRGCCGDGNPVVGCWGHEAHRRRGDTSPPRQTTVVSECIPEGQR